MSPADELDAIANELDGMLAAVRLRALSASIRQREREAVAYRRPWDDGKPGEWRSLPVQAPALNQLGYVQYAYAAQPPAADDAVLKDAERKRVGYVLMNKDGALGRSAEHADNNTHAAFLYGDSQDIVTLADVRWPANAPHRLVPAYIDAELAQRTAATEGKS